MANEGYSDLLFILCIPIFQKISEFLFKCYLLTTELSSYFLTFQQALYFNSVFLPRDIISRIALLKILCVAPKRCLKACLHRINPQAHPSATKAHICCRWTHESFLCLL